MTDKKHVNYLNLHIVHGIYLALYEFAAKDGEPIAPFDRALVQRDQLEGILGSAAHEVFGRELYPTVADKASFLFYTIAKNHVFVNGNKRMASLCVEVFLLINDYRLQATANELTDKVLEIVLSDAKMHESVKHALSSWIIQHSEQISQNEISPWSRLF